MKNKKSIPAQDQLTAAAKPVKSYDQNFVLTDEYRSSLPDMQNADAQQIFGANVPILKVGISNFRLPLRYITPTSDTQTLETSITGTVSLEANQKGINMSRIMRVFYAFQDRIFTPDLLHEILLEYKAEVIAHRAQLKLDSNTQSSSLACAVASKAGSITHAHLKVKSTSSTVSVSTFTLTLFIRLLARAHLSFRSMRVRVVMYLASRIRSVALRA